MLRCIIPAPVLNTPDFSEVFSSTNTFPKSDEKGHIRSLEFIALKDHTFNIIGTYPQKDFEIYLVEASFYPQKKLYVDSRFFEKTEIYFLPTPILDPKKILASFETYLGLPYRWGGNFANGIAQLLDYYPPKKPQREEEKEAWILKGTDCTGMLFEATNGYTPRNTSELLHFGEKIPIETTTPKTLLPLLKPLDLIVYKGHVIYVFNKTYAIESREKKGVILTPLSERLEELFAIRKPKDIYNPTTEKESFFVRRWNFFSEYL